MNYLSSAEGSVFSWIPWSGCWTYEHVRGHELTAGHMSEHDEDRRQ